MTRLKKNFNKIGPISLALADNDPNKKMKTNALHRYYLGESIDFELKDNYTQVRSFGVLIYL